MDFQQGRLLRRRVLRKLETALTAALDRELTGYARLEPQETLLLDGQEASVLTFEDGIPVAAYHTGTEREGTDALTALASSGPYRLELYELDREVLQRIHGRESLLVPPVLPAKRLSGDSQLVERTRELAPDGRIEKETSNGSDLGTVEQFLDDGEKIERLRDRARTEAKSRADEWGLPTE